MEGETRFFRLFLLPQTPRSCSFQPMLTESCYVHRSENVTDWIHVSPSFWTKGQNPWTIEQFASTAKELYY